MTEFLYHTFLYQFQIGNKTLSFQKIKRLLSNALSEYQSVTFPMTAFYDLLKLGLIDYAGNNHYSLTKSAIYTNQKSGYNLGINLPNSSFSNIREGKCKTLLGLTIIEDGCDVIAQNDIPVINFNLNAITSNFSDIRRIVRNWAHLTIEQLGSYKSLERYDYSKNKWVKTNALEGNYSIFKMFTINDFYFDFVFKLNDKFYIVNFTEYEKIRLIMLANAHKSYIKFNMEKKEVTLKPYFNYPVFLFKTMFITHVMNTGAFPNQHVFNLSKNQFLSIVTPLKLNYQIV